MLKREEYDMGGFRRRNDAATKDAQYSLRREECALDTRRKISMQLRRMHKPRCKRRSVLLQAWGKS